MKKILLGCLSLAVAMSLNAKVLATFDGNEITDLDAKPLLNGAMVDNIDALPADIKKDLVDKIVELKLLAKKAIDSGVENTDEFKKQLELAKQAIATRVYQEGKFNKIQVTEDEMKKFYDANKDSFQTPQTVTARHILVNTEKEANAIIKELKAVKPSNLISKFESIAKEKSIDPGSKENGGEIGTFPRGSMVKPFDDAAFSMKVGTFSQKPVKTQFGYHVIYKDAEKSPSVVPFDKAKAYIESQIKETKFKEQIRKEAQELRNNADVKYKFDLNATK